MEKDYSMYRYYNGTEKYLNKKAAFWGFYERSFELTYKGSKEDKFEKFNDFILTLLYEQTSDACHFGAPGVDKDKCMEDYIRVYKEPDYKSEMYE
ncbi:MAG: hypothetical protein WCK78_14285 [Paludibacter sp.]